MSTGLLTPDARLRILSDLSVVVSGAKLNTYVAGTPSTPLATTSDAAGLVPNTNPVVASATGLFGPIYLTKGLAYKLVLTDAAGVAIWTQDSVSVPNAPTLVAGTGISLVTAADVTTITATGLTLASVDVNDFRLTLETGVPVSSTDQLAKTTLYCTPGGRGNRIDLFDGTGLPTTVTSAEFSIALPAVASQVYDVFAYSNAGVATLELLAWTSDVVRATLLTLATTGAWTKTGDLTRRYLGTIRTTTVAGQSEDSQTKRYLWNAYNRAKKTLQRLEATANWPYTIATIRQANGAVANQVEVVIGLADQAISLALRALVSNSAGGGSHTTVGIGLDSTTSFLAPSLVMADPAAASFFALTAVIAHTPPIGRHVYSWNEYSVASGVTTWYGVDPVFGGSYYGLTGVVEG